jgi:hypothetical protein
MKRIRIIGLCLFAAVAMSAITVASASAAAPEFGRCLKKAVAGGAGASDSACKKPVGTGAKYEWTSTIPQNKFKAHMSTGIATLETAAGTKVTCTAETNSGAEYTGPKTVGKIVAEFSGCESGGVKCNGTGQGTGLITTTSLQGSLGVEKKGTKSPENDKLAVMLEGPGGGALAHFECSALAKIEVTGQVLHPALTNKMALTATEKFVATKAEQKPDKFAGEGVDAHILLSALNGGTPEEAGQTITALLENEDKVEASSVQ